ncbi:hypothetical protein BVX98_05340 [bacterium F11]|nr:hypothetical protein BVX98_05340 [bacterium F11]
MNNEMPPKERMERILELMSQAALRLAEKGGPNNNAEEEKPFRWKVIQVKKKSDGLEFKIQLDAPEKNLTQTQSKPPRIQLFLKQAHELHRRLEENPRLKKSALAKEIGISRFELRHNLKLLNLSPEIQKFLLALPPSRKKYPITKKKLRKISTIIDHQKQRDEFCLLLSSIYGGIWRYEVGADIKTTGQQKMLPT